MDHGSSMTGWIMTGVSTIIAGLASVVAYFYREESKRRDLREQMLIAELSNVRVRLDDCEQDRSDIKRRHAVLEERIAWVEDRVRQDRP